ncbi:MAG: helix-turn-helix transcriptional regulator [Clostridia bacterium]|nr:helix-turn-helix transcriptional regulator [Clostridia bacterium]
MWINDSHRTLKAGEMSVAFSYNAHRYYTKNNATSIYLIIPYDKCVEFNALIRDKCTDDPFITDRDTFDKIKACCDVIMNNCNTLLTTGCVYAILGILLDSMCFKPCTESVQPQKMTQILLYINENFKKDLTLSSLASKFGYNPSYLSRYFKSCFSIGINNYITKMRLREAVLLMKDHSNNVTYCAYESGFNSLRTFYRAFYSEFQCTPKEYLTK